MQGEHENLRDERAACQAFDAELAAHLEGEERPVLAAHARECVFCGVVLADMKQLISESGLLGHEDPPARIWANVRATLESEGILREQSLWQRWFPQVAFLPDPAPVLALGCLVFLGALFVTLPRSFDSSSVNRQVAAIASAEPGSSPLPAGPVVDPALQKAVEQLEKSYQAQAVSFQPAMKATYQKGLKSLDASIQECRDSVEREPGNSLAREYLVAAYEQKAEVLESALDFDGR